jgi:hypothetical protein
MSINGIQVRQDFAKFRADINTTVEQLTKIISKQSQEIEEMRAEWEAAKAQMSPEERAKFTRGHRRLTKRRDKGKDAASPST